MNENTLNMLLPLLKCQKYINNVEKYNNQEIDINFDNFTFKSKNTSYVDEFIKLYKKSNFKMIEVHNRPAYIDSLYGQTYC